MIKSEHKRIIGIDPGTGVAGYGIITSEDGKKYSALACGVWKFNRADSLANRLDQFASDFRAVVFKYKPNILILELPFVACNVYSALVLGAARGVILQQAFSLNLEINEISATSAKKTITGDGYASKEKVAQILASTLKVDFSRLPLDATDALALAYSYVYRTLGPTANESSSSNAQLLQEWQESINKKRRKKTERIVLAD